MDSKLFRIIDANCNRIAEGLRVLEDISRFILNDQVLSKQLKSIRHTVIKEVNKIGITLLTGRDSINDIGAGKELLESKTNVPSIVIANAKRVEEGLRVIEEITKHSDISEKINSFMFKEHRFIIYSLEREIVSRVLRQNKRQRIKGLYTIIDTQYIPYSNFDQVALRLINGGAKIIQLRDKNSDKKEVLSGARIIKKICSKKNVLFIINDYIDIVMEVKADGLHIGQQDIPVTVARTLLPIDTIIGCSVETAVQAQDAVAGGADYIAVSAVFPTNSKENVLITGLECLSKIKQVVSVPIVAIGGINIDNISSVIAAGADAVAVISSILSSPDITETTREFINILGK